MGSHHWEAEAKRLGAASLSIYAFVEFVRIFIFRELSFGCYCLLGAPSGALNYMQ
jgi:hypothetical protein